VLPSRHIHLFGLGTATPDGDRLAVLVEAPPRAVDVGVGGGRHGLLAGPDGLGCEERRHRSTLVFSEFNRLIGNMPFKKSVSFHPDTD